MSYMVGLEELEVMERLDPGSKPGREVYKTRHVNTGETLVLKWWSGEHRVHSHELLASLDHPQLQKTVLSGNQDGREYTASIYVDGKTLSEVALTSYDNKELVRYFIDALDPLDHIHARDLMHGDIKPHDLVLRESDGKVVVIDLESVMPHDHPLAGQWHDLRYAAPEQRGLFYSKFPSQRSDIYSLGRSMLELLIGPLWFDRYLNTISDIGNNSVKDFVKKHDLIAKGLMPAQLVPVLQKALSNQPEERYQSIGELRKALLTAYEAMYISKSRKRPYMIK
ncbi:hypothetical protein KY360_06300 [Candidatus Woesearchaeota archaeon]|nr:hypothetical protein [Candidatus Woesearchaeota archaeon]